MNRNPNLHYLGAKKFYEDNKAKKLESVSGWGSLLHNTSEIRKNLPLLLKKYEVRSIVDCPCGDWNWMQHVCLDGIGYLGLDLVDEIVEENKERFSSNLIRFDRFDLIENIPPRADLLICRDLLFHLSLDNQYKAAQNIKASNCKFLLTTTYPWVKENKELTKEELEAGWGWRQINVELEPLVFGEQIDGFKENAACHNREQRLYSISRVSRK